MAILSTRMNSFEREIASGKDGDSINKDEFFRKRNSFWKRWRFYQQGWIRSKEIVSGKDRNSINNSCKQQRSSLLTCITWFPTHAWCTTGIQMTTMEVCQIIFSVFNHTSFNKQDVSCSSLGSRHGFVWTFLYPKFYC